MSEHITGAAIPDDVMAEAARAGHEVFDANYEVLAEHDPEIAREIQQYMIQALAAALPILTPAIERNLLTRIADDAHAKGTEYFQRNGMDTGAEEMFEREEWIRSFIDSEDAQ